MSKKTITSTKQNNIYVVRQFAYVHGVTEISLLSRKKIQSAATVFHTLSRRQQQP